MPLTAKGSQKIYKELLGYGADFITLGNHAFAKSDVYELWTEISI